MNLILVVGERMRKIAIAISIVTLVAVAELPHELLVVPPEGNVDAEFLPTGSGGGGTKIGGFNYSGFHNEVFEKIYFVLRR